MARNLKYRLSGYIMLSLMIISFVSSISLMATDYTNIEDKIENKNLLPMSQNGIVSLQINGTQLYEDGRYYLFKNETLQVVSTADSDVTDAWFIFNHSQNPSENGWIKLTKAANLFSGNLYFDGDVLTGEYNAYISSKNATTYKNYTFYLEIADPEPIVQAVYLRDTKWNNVWKKIFDGQTIDTYRSTTLELRVTISNKDNIDELDSIELSFENGTQDAWVSSVLAGASGTDNIYNGMPAKNYTFTTLKTNFNSSVTGRENWRPGQRYDATIKANDTENNIWYFDFYVNILNQAPKITEFSVSPNNIASPAATNNITIIVNATDLEDDVVYDASNPDDLTYSAYSRTFGLSSTGASWNQSGSPSTTALMFRQDGSEHKIALTQNGYYMVNFTLSPIYAGHISTWQVKFRYWTNTSSNIDLEVYNYRTPGWTKPAGGDLTDGSATLAYSDKSVSLSNIDAYCRASSGYTIQVRFRQTIVPPSHWGRILYMEHINVTYQSNVRKSAPTVLLGVFNPLSSVGEWIDIKQFWNTNLATGTSGNKWSYNYTFNRQSNLQGAYTFMVRVYDYGYSDYIDNDLLTTFYFQESSRGFADASYLVNYGIPRIQLNNITNPGILINETTNPNSNKDLTVKLNVTDNFDGTHNEINYNYTADPNELYYQERSTIGPLPNDYNKVPDAYVQSMGNLSRLDQNITRVRINDNMAHNPRNQSIIFTHYLNKYYWLSAENISGIKFIINWHFDDPPLLALGLPYIGIDFFDWQINRWTNTIWTATPAVASELNPSPPNSADDDPYISTELTDSNLINRIINASSNNKLLVRVWIESSASSDFYLNCCIDFETIQVRYKNYFSAVMHVSDSEGYSASYPMENTQDGTGFRIWEYKWKIGSNSSRNYIIWFDIQNGNSSCKLIGGRYTSIKLSQFNYKLIPYVSLNEEHWWDKNYTISVKPRPLGSSFIKGQSTLFRIDQEFMTNGTLISSARVSEDFFSVFSIQFRLGGQTKHQSWALQSIDVDSTSFDYDKITGLWNLSYTFSNSYKAGRYFYRLFLKGSDNNYFATEWMDMRILNFQPSYYEITTFNPTGIYYRENTDFQFDFKVEDLESSASGITVGFQMECEDRNGNPYVWHRSADIISKIQLSSELNWFIGSFEFGREINVGTYYNLYIIVTDDDSVWPQTSKLRFNANLEIRNNAPFAELALSSNQTGNELFRNNGVQLYWNITDWDDWHYQNFTIDTFKVNYNNGTIVNPSQSLINYDAVDRRFEFNRFYSIYDSNGTHVYTINYTDPDGASFVIPQVINIKVKDNLPQLVQLQYENLNRTKEGTIEYYNLVRPGQQSNLSLFRVYRGNEVVRITVQLTDVEDSYRSDRNNNITRVYFKLIHNLLSEFDPWPNGYATWDDLKMMQTGFLNGIETWEVNITLPTHQYFYAGGMKLVMYMLDADNGYGVNNSGVFGVRNHVPYFNLIPQNNNQGYNIMVNTTYNPPAVKYGEPIIIHVYASDLDIGQLGIVRITIGFEITTQTRTIFGDAFYTANDWTYNITHDFYEITLHTDVTRNPDMSMDAKIITITDITIEDNDAGHVDDTDLYGDVLAMIAFHYELNVYDLPREPFNIWVVIIPIAAVGVAVFLVWYYRKYFSYRKYMD